ncbi:MAG TPA: hypothetical protein P5121_10720 [Caldilineaceae bacterium]|nr:hypothetical protein [Caldilineaceae bacterium]
MADTRQQAITQGTQLLQDRLPIPAQPGTTYTLYLQPLTISPLGIGSFVAAHNDPTGDILGCLVHAEASVTVTVTTVPIDEAIALLTATFLGLDTRTLRQEGLFRLHLQPLPPHLPTDSTVNVTFDVLYEYLQVPQEAGDIIQEIPLNVDLG